MMIFPRLMITAVGLALLVILALAGRNFFPTHVGVAEAIGATLGAAVNVLLQIALWSKPAVSR